MKSELQIMKLSIVTTEYRANVGVDLKELGVTRVSCFGTLYNL